MNDLPVLLGQQRARLQDFNWATAMFGWAFAELRRVKAKISDVAVIEDAITEQLENWEPSNGPN
jgi:hypothetical protein